MQNAFVNVVIAVGVVGVLGALAALLTSRRTWESLGADGLLKDSDSGDARRALERASREPDPARDDEIRQLLAARNARRARRGQDPLDVEAELARLTVPVAPALDRQLRAEIRELVVARNHRRVRRGLPTLDVEAEVEREVARLSE